MELSWFDATTGHALWRHPIDYDWDLSPVTADGSTIFALSPLGDLHEFATTDSGAEHDAKLTGAGFEQFDQHTMLSFGGVLVVTVPSPGTATIAGLPHRVDHRLGRAETTDAGTGVE